MKEKKRVGRYLGPQRTLELNPESPFFSVLCARFGFHRPASIPGFASPSRKDSLRNGVGS
jgi:hypothetical protein